MIPYYVSKVKKNEYNELEWETEKWQMWCVAQLGSICTI